MRYNMLVVLQGIIIYWIFLLQPRFWFLWAEDMARRPTRVQWAFSAIFDQVSGASTFVAFSLVLLSFLWAFSAEVAWLWACEARFLLSGLCLPHPCSLVWSTFWPVFYLSHSLCIGLHQLLVLLTYFWLKLFCHLNVASEAVIPFHVVRQ